MMPETIFTGFTGNQKHTQLENIKLYRDVITKKDI